MALLLLHPQLEHYLELVNNTGAHKEHNNSSSDSELQTATLGGDHRCNTCGVVASKPDDGGDSVPSHGSTVTGAFSASVIPPFQKDNDVLFSPRTYFAYCHVHSFLAAVAMIATIFILALYRHEGVTTTATTTNAAIQDLWNVVCIFTMLVYITDRGYRKKTNRNGVVDHKIPGYDPSPTGGSLRKEPKSCRMEISQMLGRIGAPLLDGTNTVDSNPLMTGVKETLPATSNLEKLVQLTRVHVEWIHTVDAIIRLLRQVTGIQLGLGSKSRSVMRVEQANLIRCGRKGPFEQDTTTDTRYTVSLATIRQRLYQGIQKHDQLLLSLLSKFTDVDNLLNDDLDDIVLSLTTLQAMRDDSNTLLSEILERLLTTSEHGGLLPLENRIDYICSKTSETILYFSSWLEHPMGYLSGNEHDVLPISDDLDQFITIVDEQVSHLRMALLGCRGVGGSTLTERGGDDTARNYDHRAFQIFWEEAKRIVGAMQRKIDDFNVESFVRKCQGLTRLDDGIPSLTSMDTLDDSRVGLRDVEMLIPKDSSEYTTAQDRGNGEISCHAPSDQSLMDAAPNTVLIYSGKGSMYPKASRSISTRPHHTPDRIPPSVSVGTEQQLMEELKRHLRMLPHMEEICMTAFSDLDSWREQATVVQVATSEADGEDITSETTCRVAPSAFLTELTKALSEANSDVTDIHDC